MAPPVAKKSFPASERLSPNATIPVNGPAELGDAAREERLSRAATELVERPCQISPIEPRGYTMLPHQKSSFSGHFPAKSG